MKNQKLFVRIVCIVLVVLMAVSVGAVAITAFSANAAQSTEEVSASVSAGTSGYINASCKSEKRCRHELFGYNLYGKEHKIYFC